MTEHPSGEHPSGEPASAAEPGVAARAVQHASGQEDPTAAAEGLGDHATGDAPIDAALADLQGAPADDLDAQIDAGQQVQQTLQARLSDLGGA